MTAQSYLCFGVRTIPASGLGVSYFDSWPGS